MKRTATYLGFILGAGLGCLSSCAPVGGVAEPEAAATPRPAGLPAPTPRKAAAPAAVEADEEVSVAVLILVRGVGTGLEWTDADGEKLRFEDQIRYELDQPIETAACGGTQRLFGLSGAYHLHLREGGREEGVW